MEIEEIKNEVKPRVHEQLSSLIVVYLIYFLYQVIIPFHYLFFPIELGINMFYSKFVNNRETNLSDIFYYMEDWQDFIFTGFLRRIKTFFYLLLGIFPGIIKHYQYSLVPMILIDEQFENVRGKDCLELSKKMMENHIVDALLLDLSFIYWHLLAIFTFGFIELYVMPYQLTTKYKFLYEIKKNYLGREPSFMMESDAIYTPVGVIKRKQASVIAINKDQTGNFKAKYCMNCGQELAPNSKSCIYCGYIYDDPLKQEKDSV